MFWFVQDAIYLEQGLFDQRLDLNAVMSPMPRHHQVGASPLKFKNDITTVIRKVIMSPARLWFD